MRHLALSFSLALLMCPASALGGDEQGAVPPPQLPRGASPPSPSASAPSPAPAIDEARLAAMIDDAVDRAMARRQAASGPPAGAYASPQQGAPLPPRPSAQLRIVAAEPVRAVGTVPAYSESREYVTVMVPPGCCKRAMAAVGQKLVECGRPRLRTMRVAPSALVQEVPVRAARPVYATGQGG